MTSEIGIVGMGCIGLTSLLRPFFHYTLTGYFYCECEEEMWVYSIGSGKAIECKACGAKYNITEPRYEVVLGDKE